MRRERKEPRGGIANVTCDAVMMQGAGVCKHPGMHHPATIGEVLEAVLYGYVVHDVDGDVITSARPGDWTDTADEEGDFRYWNGADTPVITYTYCTVGRWNDAVADSEAVTDHWRHETSNAVASPRWSRWLIEDLDLSDDELAEVRKSLGLEE